MKNFRGFTLGLVLGLAAAFATLGFAQNATQTDADKTKESCCAMASCCCKGDSCAMKDDSKNKSDKHECCCCGDSCNMKDMKGMKDMKNKPQ